MANTKAPKKVTKKQTDKVFAFFTEHGKSKTVTVVPIEGVTVKADYTYDFNLRYGLDVNVDEYDVKVGKQLAKLEELLGGWTLEELINEHADANDIVPDKEYNKLSKDFSKALDAIPQELRYKLGNIEDYKDADAFWNRVNDLQNFVAPPPPTTFRINGSYSASITKGEENIQVGCQSIPVSQVRALLAKIDEVNQPTPAKK